MCFCLSHAISTDFRTRVTNDTLQNDIKSHTLASLPTVRSFQNVNKRLKTVIFRGSKTKDCNLVAFLQQKLRQTPHVITILY